MSKKNNYNTYRGYFIFLLFLAGISAFFIFFNKDFFEQKNLQLIHVWVAWISIFFVLTLTIILFIQYKKHMLNKQQKPFKPAVKQLDDEALSFLDLTPQIRSHLRTRYGFFWKRKVRVLLVVGEMSAITRLAADLLTQRWLESERTVLIYAGTLSNPIPPEALSQIRKLRRKPVNGLVWVRDSSQEIPHTDQVMRSFEKMGISLGYQPPLWLWQLYNSEWEQTDRTEQPVSVVLPYKAKPSDLTKGLTQLLPQLRQHGLAQTLSHSNHDFLLRLAHDLEEEKINDWEKSLTPWLTLHQKRVPLRGVMLSLPAEQTLDSNLHANSVDLTDNWRFVAASSAQMSGVTLSKSWQNVLGYSLLVAMGAWAFGMLVSSASNMQQINQVATQTKPIRQTLAFTDEQFIALHQLRNEVQRLQQWDIESAPWYEQFGLDHSHALLEKALALYGVANNYLIRDPAAEALRAKLEHLANLLPDSPERSVLAKPGYSQLKAWLMMVRPEKAQADFYSQTMQAVLPQQKGISVGLWENLAPDLWYFYAKNLPTQPSWKIENDSNLVTQSRQVLLEQIGRRNAENALYDTMIQAIGHNYADLRLEDMTNGLDARPLFYTQATVAGVYTRQAWEGRVKKAIEKAANSRRDEIDWVLSDSKQTANKSLSPDALQKRLTQHYFQDFSSAWLNFLNSLQWKNTTSISDITDQLTLMSDVRQSPFIALMNTVALQGQTGQTGKALTDTFLDSAKKMMDKKPTDVIDQSSPQITGPMDSTFGPILAIMGKGDGRQIQATDGSLSLQTYLTRLTRVRLRMQQVVNASDPQQMVQTMAQTVFQGKSIDLTDTQQYGSLVAASLGEQWSGFGDAMFVQPLTQAWKTVLNPSAASLNDAWQRSIVTYWNTAFEGRYPFSETKSEASLPMIADFIRPDTGRVDRFLNTQLKGVLHKEGNYWVPDRAHSQGLTFNPRFLNAINQLGELSNVLFIDGKQGIQFELQARPTSGVVETKLMIDGQKLDYFNQMAQWTNFYWPGEDTYKPGTSLTWTSTQTGSRLFGDYAGTWGLIRWLDNATTKRLDNSRWMLSFKTSDGRTLQWVLRTQLMQGPLALKQMHGFQLPQHIFIVK